MPRTSVQKDSEFYLLSHYDSLEVNFTGNVKGTLWDKHTFQDGLTGNENDSKVVAGVMERSLLTTEYFVSYLSRKI